MNLYIEKTILVSEEDMLHDVRIVKFMGGEQFSNEATIVTNALTQKDLYDKQMKEFKDIYGYAVSSPFDANKNQTFGNAINFDE